MNKGAEMDIHEVLQRCSVMTGLDAYAVEPDGSNALVLPIEVVEMLLMRVEVG